MQLQIFLGFTPRMVPQLSLVTAVQIEYFDYICITCNSWDVPPCSMPVESESVCWGSPVAFKDGILGFWVSKLCSNFGINFQDNFPRLNRGQSKITIFILES